MRSARLAVDHSNIRAAYAVYMTADLTGAVDLAAGSSHTPKSTDLYSVIMQKDGTFSATSTDNDYLLQVNAEERECAESVGCSQAKTKALGTTAGEHKENNKIIIAHDASDNWYLVLDTAAPTT